MTEKPPDAVFEVAAEFFSLLSAPLRLRILHELCSGEHSVAQLLEAIPATQPNMSQHLNTLYRAGVLSRRREGVQVIYRLQSERTRLLCQSMCPAIASGDLTAAQAPTESLLQPSPNKENP